MATQPFRALRHAGSPSTGGSAFSLESHINSGNAHPGYVKKGDQVGSVNITAHEADKGAHAQYYIRRMEMALNKTDYDNTKSLSVGRYSGDTASALAAMDHTVVTTHLIDDLVTNYPEDFLPSMIPYWHIIDTLYDEDGNVVLGMDKIPEYLWSEYTSFTVNDDTADVFIPSWKLFKNLHKQVQTHELPYDQNPLNSIFAWVNHRHDDVYAAKDHRHTFEEITNGQGDIPAASNHNHDSVYVRKDDVDAALDLSPLARAGVFPSSAVVSDVASFDLNLYNTHGNRTFFVSKTDTLLGFPQEFMSARNKRYTDDLDYTVDKLSNASNIDTVTLNISRGTNAEFDFSADNISDYLSGSSTSCYTHQSITQVLIANGGVSPIARLNRDSATVADAVKNYKYGMNQIYWRAGYSLETAWFITSVLSQFLDLTPKEFYELPGKASDSVTGIATVVNTALYKEISNIQNAGSGTGDLPEGVSAGLFRPDTTGYITYDTLSWLTRGIIGAGAATAVSLSYMANLRNANTRLQSHDLVDILIPQTRTVSTWTTSAPQSAFDNFEMYELHNRIVPYINYFDPATAYYAIEDFTNPVNFSNTYAVKDEEGGYNPVSPSASATLASKLNVSSNSCSNCIVTTEYKDLFDIDDVSYILHEYRPIVEADQTYQEGVVYYKRGTGTDAYGVRNYVVHTGWTAGAAIPVPSSATSNNFIYKRVAVTSAGGYLWNKRPVSRATLSGTTYVGGEAYDDSKTYYKYAYNSTKQQYEWVVTHPAEKINTANKVVVYGTDPIFTNYDLYTAEGVYNLVTASTTNQNLIDVTTAGYLTTKGISYIKYVGTSKVNAFIRTLETVEAEDVPGTMYNTNRRYILRKLDASGNPITTAAGIVDRDLSEENLETLKEAFAAGTTYNSINVSQLQLGTIFSDSSDRAYLYEGEPIPVGYNSTTKQYYSIYAINIPVYDKTPAQVYQAGYFFMTKDETAVAHKKYYTFSGDQYNPVYERMTVNADDPVTGAYECICMEDFFNYWRAIKELTSTGGYNTTAIDQKITYNFGTDGNLVTWDPWCRVITTNDELYKYLGDVTGDNEDLATWINKVNERLITTGSTTLSIYRVKFGEIRTKSQLALWTYRADGASVNPQTASNQYFTINLSHTKFGSSYVDISDITTSNVDVEMELEDVNTKKIFKPIAKYSFKDDGTVYPVFKDPMFRIRFDQDNENKLLDMVLPDKWFTDGNEGGEANFSRWMPIELPTTAGTKKITLYAVIHKATGVINGTASFTVTFMTMDDVLSTYECPFGQPVVFPDNPPNPTGLHFGGWKDNGVKITNTSRYVVSGDTVIRAWYYAIFSFDTDGGNTVNPFNVEYGTQGTLPTATKKYCSIKHWKNTATNTTHAVGAKITADVDKSYKAIWDLYEYTITVDYNYTGAPANGSIKVTVENLGKVTTPSTVSRANWSLAGYYTAKSGGTKIYDASGNVVISKPYSSKWDFDTYPTIYARWNPAKKTIVMHDNNATISAPETVQKLVFTQASPAPELAIPVNYGYTFVKYSASGTTMTAELSGDGTKMVYPGCTNTSWDFSKPAGTYIFSDFSNYYASWTAKTTSSVTIKKMFASTADSTTITNLTFGQLMPKTVPSSYLPPRSLSGYTFDGYGEIENPSVTLDTQPEIAVVIGKYYDATGNPVHKWDREPDDKFTLYPIWIKNSDGSLNYYLDIYMNGADNARSYISTTHNGKNRYGIASVKVNRKDQLSSSIFSGIGSPTRTGYRFVGYSIYNSATDVMGEHLFDASCNPINASKRWKDFDPVVTEMVAAWSPNNYNLVLLDTDGTTKLKTVACEYGKTVGDISLSGVTLPTTSNARFNGWGLDSLGMVFTKEGKSTNVAITAYSINPNDYDVYLNPMWIQTITVELISEKEATASLWIGSDFTSTQPAANTVIGTSTVDFDATNLGIRCELLATGYRHTGWQAYQRDGAAYNSIVFDAKYYIPNNDLYFQGGHSYRLKATWAAREYTISLEYGSKRESLTATYDQVVPSSTEFAGTNAPSQTGHTFLGWSYDGTYLLNADGSSKNTTYKIADNISLTAGFQAHTTHVGLNVNYGGTAVSDYVDLDYGTSSYDLGTPESRSGYEFLGWYDDATGGTKYAGADGKSVKSWDKDPNANSSGVRNSTLYAHWNQTVTEVNSIVYYNKPSNSKVEVVATSGDVSIEVYDSTNKLYYRIVTGYDYDPVYKVKCTPDTGYECKSYTIGNLYTSGTAKYTVEGGNNVAVTTGNIGTNYTTVKFDVTAFVSEFQATVEFLDASSEEYVDGGTVLAGKNTTREGNTLSRKNNSTVNFTVIAPYDMIIDHIDFHNSAIYIGSADRFTGSCDLGTNPLENVITVWVTHSPRPSISASAGVIRFEGNRWQMLMSDKATWKDMTDADSTGLVYDKSAGKFYAYSDELTEYDDNKSTDIVYGRLFDSSKGTLSANTTVKTKLQKITISYGDVRLTAEGEALFYYYQRDVSGNIGIMSVGMSPVYLTTFAANSGGLSITENGRTGRWPNSSTYTALSSNTSTSSSTLRVKLLALGNDGGKWYVKYINAVGDDSPSSMAENYVSNSANYNQREVNGDTTVTIT